MSRCEKIRARKRYCAKMITEDCRGCEFFVLNDFNCLSLDCKPSKLSDYMVDAAYDLIKLCAGE